MFLALNKVLHIVKRNTKVFSKMRPAKKEDQRQNAEFVCDSSDFLNNKKKNRQEYEICTVITMW